MKRCSVCKQEKELSSFSRQIRHKDLKSSSCKTCAASKTRDWYRKNPVKAHTTRLIRDYDITSEQYTAWNDAFDKVCHICSKACPSGRRLAVDHDHTSGLVRGLLCINCNKGLGNFKDNKELLKLAISYLQFAEETAEYVKNALNSQANQGRVQTQRRG